MTPRRFPLFTRSSPALKRLRAARRSRPFAHASLAILIGILPAAAAVTLTDLFGFFPSAAQAAESAEVERTSPELPRAERAPLSPFAHGDALIHALTAADDSAVLPASAEPPRPDASAAPGSIVLLWSPGLAPEENAALARDARRLGIPFVISGLPVKARRPEAMAKALEAGDIRRASPFVLDRAAAAELGKEASRLGITLAASPEAWHAVRDGLSAEPLAPALVLFGERCIEVFPGSVRPLWTLAWARDHAETAEIRALADRRIRAAGLESEARLARP